MRHQVCGREGEQLSRKLLTLGAGLQEGFPEAPRGGQAAGKADPFQGHPMTPGRLEHEPAHQVMRQEAHPDFPFKVRRVFAA